MVQPRLCCLLLAISLISNGEGGNATSSMSVSATPDVNTTSHETTTPFTTGGSTAAVTPSSLPSSSPQPPSLTSMSMGTVSEEPSFVPVDTASAPAATPEYPSDPGEGNSSSSVALVAVGFGIGIPLGFLLAIILVIVIVAIMKKKWTHPMQIEGNVNAAYGTQLTAISTNQNEAYGDSMEAPVYDAIIDGTANADYDYPQQV